MKLSLKLSRIPVFFFNHGEKDRINTSSATAFSRISVTWSSSSGDNLCGPSEKYSWWKSHILFLPAAANELVSLNPKLGNLKTHNSSLFGLFGSRNGNFEFGSPWSQIADINDPSGSMSDLL